ncbi:MAG: acetolactate synthase large subunit, partial [Muribaculaceae bacterium]|nr:acetolactate synthase large subunit [Muribaculaceae bacterium]
MENNHISGAEALLKSLICEGVDTIFGYPGGQIISVYDKLYDYTDQLHHILVRHEQGAIHAAQGYARTTGRPGVVIVTSGPGATNVITGLADALMDNTPIVVISGQVASDFLGTDAFQEADVVAMTQQATKWAIQIRRPEEIPAAVARAFYIASTGRPGPVVLDIAKDAQVGMMDWSHERCRAIRSYDPCPKINPQDIDEVAQLLETAKKPMIIAGHGVMIANAEKSLLEVAEKGNIPVATTLLGLSTIPSDHPLNKGMVGMHGNLGPNSASLEADLIIGVG